MQPFFHRPYGPKPGDQLSSHRKREEAEAIYNLQRRQTEIDTLQLSKLDYSKAGIYQIPEAQWSWDADSEIPYFPNCQPVYWFKSGKLYQANPNHRAETLYVSVPFCPKEHRTALLASLRPSNNWPCPYSKGDWVWSLFNAQSGRWEIIGDYEDIWRFELIEALTASTSSSSSSSNQASPFGTASALAALILYDRVLDDWYRVTPPFTCNSSSSSSSSGQDTTFSFRVYDPLQFGPLACGYRGLAKRFGDSSKWELIGGGGGCSIELDVCTDHRPNADTFCIQLGFQRVHVCYVDPEVVWENLFCTTECATSSSSSGA